MTKMDKLSTLLKIARDKKKWTQGEVSKRMGWGESCLYSHLESGVGTGKGKHMRVPQKESAVALAKVLKIPYAELAEACIERMAENKRKLYFGK